MVEIGIIFPLTFFDDFSCNDVSFVLLNTLKIFQTSNSNIDGDSWYSQIPFLIIPPLQLISTSQKNDNILYNWFKNDNPIKLLIAQSHQNASLFLLIYICSDRFGGILNLILRNGNKLQKWSLFFSIL
jgi:hypothetical protein